jgi:flagellar biogenesis protein FliO
MDTSASAALIAVLALAAVAVWLVARREGGLFSGRGRTRGPAEVVQRLPLTAQHSLHVIRAGGETLWVITYPNGAVLSSGRSFQEDLEAMAALRREDPQ